MRRISFGSKKRIVIIVLCIVAIFAGYALMHKGLNIFARHRYASEDRGFQKNALGDYYKNSDGIIMNFYDAGFTSFKTNLSVGNDEVALIIWISLINDKKKYGIIIQDHDAEITDQIPVNRELKAKNPEKQGVLDGKKKEIDAMRKVVNKEWNLNL